MTTFIIIPRGVNSAGSAFNKLVMILGLKPLTNAAPLLSLLTGTLSELLRFQNTTAGIS
jgi:hypothetical protein